MYKLPVRAYIINLFTVLATDWLPYFIEYSEHFYTL